MDDPATGEVDRGKSLLIFTEGIELERRRRAVRIPTLLKNGTFRCFLDLLIMAYTISFGGIGLTYTLARKFVSIVRGTDKHQFIWRAAYPKLQPTKKLCADAVLGFVRKHR